MMAKSASQVIHKMSTSLQAEVVMLVHSHWLKQIWFLRGCEPPCLVQLALRMEPYVFAPSEQPEQSNLYVIHRGIVMHGTRVLTSGSMWGEEIMLEADRLSKYPAILARCMTYVEVYSISQSAFYKVTNAFSEAKRLVRTRAVHVIARRAIIRLVNELKEKKAHGDGRSFMELVLDAASNTAQTNLAKVISDGGGGGFSQVLEDELIATKTSVESLRTETRTELGALTEQMSAMREGLNQLLAAQGIAEVKPPQTRSRRGSGSG